MRRFSSIVNQYIENKSQLIAMTRIDKMGTFVIKMFNELNYDFNIEAHRSLVERVNLNKNLTNPQKSFIYYLAITAFTKDKRAVFFHAFTMKQFHNIELNKTCYRLFQSFLDEFSLYQFLNKKYEKRDYFLSEEEVLQVMSLRFVEDEIDPLNPLINLKEILEPVFKLPDEPNFN